MQSFDQDIAARVDQLEFALQAADVGTWDLDLINQLVRWDERCKQLYGFSKDDVVPYDQVLRYIHPDDRANVDRAVLWALDPRSGGVYDAEFRTIGAEDGQLRWLRCKGKAFFNQAGVAYRFSGTAQDHMPIVLARQALEASERRFRDLALGSPTPTVVFTGRDMRVDLINSPMLRIWGKDDSVLGKPLETAMPELVGQPFLSLLQRVFDTGETYRNPAGRADIVIDGQLKTFWFNFLYNPLYSADGHIYGVINTATDITESVLANQELEESEQRFRSLIEEAPLATCLFVGRELRIEVANDVMLSFWGTDRHVIGRKLAETIPELQGQPFLDILDGVYTSGKTYEAKSTPALLAVNGIMGTYYFDFIYKPLRNAAGDVYAIMEMAADVTQEVLAHQQLAASEQRYRQLADELEGRIQQRTHELVVANLDLKRSNDNLQQFAYVASHDLQEPLRKIQSFSSLLQDQYASQLTEGGADLLRRIATAGSRMSTLIRDLLAYSRIATRQQTFGLVSLPTIIENVLNTLELAIVQTGAQINVAELPVLKGDELQLRQLFQNLLANAIKFTQPNSTPYVQITSQLYQRSDLPPEINPTSDAQLFYRIDVQDKGVGFDNKYRDRIFQVFQRLHNRSEFEGTGVGLAICQRVVENHGGGITADSEPGKGATFCVYLPQ